MKPITENITNPAKMDVPQLIIGIMMASLQPEEILFSFTMKECKLHTWVRSSQYPTIRSFFFFKFQAVFKEIAPNSLMSCPGNLYQPVAVVVEPIVAGHSY